MIKKINIRTFAIIILILAMSSWQHAMAQTDSLKVKVTGKIGISYEGYRLSNNP